MFPDVLHAPRLILRPIALDDAGVISDTSAQRFVAIHAAIYNVFNVQRHLIRRATLQSFRAEAHQAWDDAAVAA